MVMGVETTKMQLPSGWLAEVWPEAWDPAADSRPELDLQRVGNVLLPPAFYLILTSRELGDLDSEHPPGFVLTFVASDGELTVKSVGATNLDLAESMGLLIEAFPPKYWKSTATIMMIGFLAEDGDDRGAPDIVVKTEDGLKTMAQAKQYRPTRAPGSKRYKITEQHLKEVVRIYSESVELGEPPTKAVAEAFEVAHSTAAKWVGAARRSGLLEGVAQRWGKGRE
ncbi:hypothetical protein [Streptomyces sp. NPDC008141]|uniref:hypothetical protein n=1 Tax=Streptomyces sp. NPDC008141 TaxID=3364815 RepID=UPI0036E7EA32